ncbi:nephrin isoform X1 [Trichogramma pretiosum]|uniref:nephrin isoform X1 n=1 Tax=Trichogramma pretiosum TaxID=7493 RepID=UPI000C71BC00|nr:nephrin isoform X1 [Trichogramma pretiosum]XP_023316785.1 nephrin isoform X1 [Trichogramma pretiosum]
MTWSQQHYALEVFVALLAVGIVFGQLHFVYAQGVPRTFSSRPFRGVFPVAGPPQLARAVLQGTAELPCDVRPPGPNDTFILVVWYKQDVNPIYSYDIRGKHSEKPNQWMVEYLNQRAYFQTRKYPATLNINHVQEDDEGEYRCRVDFLKSPTRNSRVKLDIIIPPARPNIINEQGKTVGTLAGPYVEGGDMKLSCSVSGGRPEPVVRWWRGEMLLDATVARGDLVKRSTLVVRNLTRSDLHAKFTCQASNNNISQPVSASVAIDMYLSPLNVTILTSEDAPLSAGRQYEITCITVGSRPAANLSWYMEGQSLKNFTQKVSSAGNMTTSNLTFTPTKSDNGTSITCRAENPNVKAAVMEDTLKLNVFYVPTLTLSLGSNMNPDDIEEGDDVYFDCKVDANPSAYKVVWKHNGIVLQNNAKLGMIVQQTSLALRKVNRSQAGNYTCIASNVEGDGYSNIVELKIMYKPICVQDQKRIYGVARHEEARVLCQVEAYPPPDSFRWAFNNTEEMNDVSSARHSDSTISAQSVLTYKPVSETDYGTVLCWASNTAGQQKNACIFHIIAAGKPEPPYNCTLTNQTTQSLSVECTAGFDGGQTQHFQLEVFDQLTGQLRANVSSRDSATFHVHELEPGRVLRMSVYAVNAKGRSEPTLLEGFTLKVAEKQTVRVLFTGTPVPFEITPLLGILIGCLGVLLFCTVAVLLAMKLRSDRRGGGGHQRPGDLPLKKSAAPSSEDLYDPDDRNPDVVPTNKDSDYQLTGSTAGTPLAVQPTPDSLTSTTTTALPPPSQLVANHLPNYSHNDYNNYPTLPLSGEITYAELCLPRPSNLTTTTTTGTTKHQTNGTSTPTPIIGDGGTKLLGLSSLAGFTTTKPPPYPSKEATIYASIDHTATSQRGGVNLNSVASTPSSLHGSSVGTPCQEQLMKQHHPREVVTVRTPLISSQESCV